MRLILTLLFFTPYFFFSQINYCIEIPDSLLVNLGLLPQYPTGIDGIRTEMNEYVENCNYPKPENKAILVLRFEVCMDGSIGEAVEILRPIESCPTCSVIAIQSIEHLKHKFKPGETMGKPTDVWFTIPVIFD